MIFQGAVNANLLAVSSFVDPLRGTKKAQKIPPVGNVSEVLPAAFRAASSLSAPSAPSIVCTQKDWHEATKLFESIGPVVAASEKATGPGTPRAPVQTVKTLQERLLEDYDDLCSLNADQLQALYMMVQYNANSHFVRAQESVFDLMSRLHARAREIQTTTLEEANLQLQRTASDQDLYHKIGTGLRIGTLALTGILVAASAGMGPAFVLMAASACVGAAVGAAVQGDVRHGKWSAEGALTGAESGVALATGAIGVGGLLAGAAKVQQVVSRTPGLLSTSQVAKTFGAGMLEGLSRWTRPLGGLAQELSSSAHVSSLVLGLPGAIVTHVGNLKVNLGVQEAHRMQVDAKGLALLMTGLGEMLRTGRQFTLGTVRCHEKAMQGMQKMGEQRSETVLRTARNIIH